MLCLTCCRVRVRFWVGVLFGVLGVSKPPDSCCVQVAGGYFAPIGGGSG